MIFHPMATPQKQELAALAATLYSTNASLKNEAFERLVRLAEQGSSEAMYLMHLCYEQGNGVPESQEAACYWLERACSCKNPFPPALANKGGRLLNEPGKLLAGLELLERAASMGSADAAMTAAKIYEEGRLVQQDTMRAYSLLAHALEVGGQSISIAFSSFSERNHKKLKGLLA